MQESKPMDLKKEQKKIRQNEVHLLLQRGASGPSNFAMTLETDRSARSAGSASALSGLRLKE